MMSFVIAIHVIACILLITIVLVQRGRGGGFVENLSGLESMFGTKTSAFLTKATTVSAVVFFVTCLSLAVMSVHKSRSLLQGYRSAPVSTQKTPAAPLSQQAAPAQAPAAPVESVPVATPQPAVTQQPAAVQPPVQAEDQPALKTRSAPQPRQGELK
ncbi:MAG: preprotein translocase subunit SecG [Candidatus Omnitrophota bacterium]